MYQTILVPVIIVWAVTVFQELKTKKTKNKDKKDSKALQILEQKSFITAYRSHMLILTNFAILAVDFHIFPRRFAKVETWGTSIMDMGVGSFVFSMGLVNSRSIIKQKLTKSTSSNYLLLIISNIQKSVPMLVFGVIRLMSVKSLEYQEHVTEYGIHWNFFITLGLLPIFLAILNPLLEVFPRALVAFMITGVYELVLCNTDLLAYVLASDNRMNSIISMNKEGICSFFGYLSIFIFGQSFGSFVLTSTKTPNNLIEFSLTGKPKSWLTVTTTKGLVISTILYQTLAIFIKESPLFYNVSRRLANLPYVMMIISYNSTFLLLYHLCDKLTNGKNTGSKILDSVNKNGLFFFLIGNLLTGLTNMSINTLQCDDRTAFLVLLVYGLVITSAVYILDYFGIYIKI